MTKLSDKMLALAAAKKLSSSSPPAAHFHRAMREYHKEQAKDYMRDAKMPQGASQYSPQHFKDIANMHKNYAAHHDAEYKKANK